MVPACRIGNLTNELPQECQTANTGRDTPPVTVYRHGANLLPCYPLMLTLHWNTYLTILMSWVRPYWEILPNLPYTQHTLNSVLLLWWQSVRSDK